MQIKESLSAPPGEIVSDKEVEGASSCHTRNVVLGYLKKIDCLFVNKDKLRNKCDDNFFPTHDKTALVTVLFMSI